MPVEHFSALLAVEVSGADGDLIEDESSLFVGDILGSRRV